MLVFDCTHKADTSARYVCTHLLGVRDADYHQVFTGEGRAYWLACAVRERAGNRGDSLADRL